MIRLSPATASSPPLNLVAPFLLAAPLGLLAAGLLLATTDASAFAAINVPRNVAATHAAIIGGLTTGIMGAVYQLGPAVLGGRLVSHTLARIQFAFHAVSVPLFVWALLERNLTFMSAAAMAVLVSFVLFLVNAVPAIGGLRKANAVMRAYVGVALGMLVVTGSLGITWVGTLQHLWFPVTMGRLAGHAHMGLLGWLGLTVMGVSYQLVPMFNVVQKRQARLAWWALAVTSIAALGGGLALMTDPGREGRLVIAAAMAAGPALWAMDILRLLAARSRRTLDVQGRATFVSLGFLGVAMVLGMVVAFGKPLLDPGQAGRWQLAYGICGIGGWVGLTFVGNSFKIVPFLVWYHRYRFLAGRGPVPMISDVYNDRVANIVLTAYAVALAVMALGAGLGELSVLRGGAGLLAVAATAHAGSLAHIVFAPHAAATARPVGRGVLR
ncbi:MAG: hypothetical protein C0506_12480 [Anaerolinea sp.]|nr:hypothetical protein [Anaerolinea sp.]